MDASNSIQAVVVDAYANVQVALNCTLVARLVPADTTDLEAFDADAALYRTRYPGARPAQPLLRGEAVRPCTNGRFSLAVLAAGEHRLLFGLLDDLGLPPLAANPPPPLPAAADAWISALSRPFVVTAAAAVALRFFAQPQACADAAQPLAFGGDVAATPLLCTCARSAREGLGGPGVGCSPAAPESHDAHAPAPIRRQAD